MAWHATFITSENNFLSFDVVWCTWQLPHKLMTIFQVQTNEGIIEKHFGAEVGFFWQTVRNEEHSHYADDELQNVSELLFSSSSSKIWIQHIENYRHIIDCFYHKQKTILSKFCSNATNTLSSIARILFHQGFHQGFTLEILGFTDWSLFCLMYLGVALSLTLGTQLPVKCNFEDKSEIRVILTLMLGRLLLAKTQNLSKLIYLHLVSSWRREMIYRIRWCSSTRIYTGIVARCLLF